MIFFVLFLRDILAFSTRRTLHLRLLLREDEDHIRYQNDLIIQDIYSDVYQKEAIKKVADHDVSLLSMKQELVIFRQLTEFKQTDHVVSDFRILMTEKCRNF